MFVILDALDDKGNEKSICINSELVAVVEPGKKCTYLISATGFCLATLVEADVGHVSKLLTNREP